MNKCKQKSPAVRPITRTISLAEATANFRATFPWVFPPSCAGYAGPVPDFTTGKFLVARLKELRKRHLITQEKFSEMSGIAYKYYQLIEIGKRIDLRLSTLTKLAKAYGIEVSELLASEMPKTTFPKRVPTTRKKGHSIEPRKKRVSGRAH